MMSRTRAGISFALDTEQLLEHYADEYTLDCVDNQKETLEMNPNLECAASTRIYVSGSQNLDGTKKPKDSSPKTIIKLGTDLKS